MTLEEWQQLAALLENGWRGGFDDERSAAYFVFLGRYDAVDVERALHVLVRDGKPFIPAVAEIVQAIEQDPSVPSWPEAYRMIFGPRGVLCARAPRGTAPGERRRFEEQAAIDRAAGLHPLLAPFVAAEGVQRLRMLPVDDPDWGGLERRRLGERWTEFLSRVEGRRRQGLAIEAASVWSLSGPRRLDPAALVAGVDDQAQRKEVA